MQIIINYKFENYFEIKFFYNLISTRGACSYGVTFHNAKQLA